MQSHSPARRYPSWWLASLLWICLCCQVAPAIAQEAAVDTALVADSIQQATTEDSSLSSSYRPRAVMLSVSATYYMIENHAPFPKNGTLDIEGYTFRIPSVHNDYAVGGSLGVLFSQRKTRTQAWRAALELSYYENHGYYAWQDTLAPAGISTFGVQAWAEPPIGLLVFRPIIGFGGHISEFDLARAVTDSSGNRFDASYTFIGLNIVAGVHAYVNRNVWLSSRAAIRSVFLPGVHIEGTNVTESFEGDSGPVYLDVQFALYVATGG